LSTKDVIARLTAWQQRHIARLEAALHNRDPVFPGWPAGLNPESGKDRELINAWIHEACRQQPWPGVYRDWRQGFLRFLKLGQAIPEADLLDAGKYPWMKGQPLCAALLASCRQHHEERIMALRALLGENAHLTSTG
jgi:hypothetical protein